MTAEDNYDSLVSCWRCDEMTDFGRRPPGFESATRYQYLQNNGEKKKRWGTKTDCRTRGAFNDVADVGTREMPYRARRSVPRHVQHEQPRTFPSSYRVFPKSKHLCIALGRRCPDSRCPCKKSRSGPLLHDCSGANWCRHPAELLSGYSVGVERCRNIWYVV